MREKTVNQFDKCTTPDFAHMKKIYCYVALKKIDIMQSKAWNKLVNVPDLITEIFFNKRSSLYILWPSNIWIFYHEITILVTMCMIEKHRNNIFIY